MLEKMAKSIDVGSEWYVVSMKWIEKWQHYVNFDGGEETKSTERKPPGKVDNTDLIQPYSNFVKKGEVMSVFLNEIANKELWQNFQLKRNLKEGDDYMLVDKNIHAYWVAKYGKVNEIKRFGIEDENGESVVEIHLKQFNLYPIPNKSLFKFSVREEEEGKSAYELFTQPIYTSKSCTVKELAAKVVRVLNGYLYFVKKNKGVMLREARLWRSNYAEEEALKSLQELESKYGNFTHARVDAQILNISEDQLAKKLHEIDYSDTDILIVELPKKDGYVFQPKAAGEGEEEGKHAGFEDPLDNEGLTAI